MRGQRFGCPCHGVPAGQDSQEEVWPAVHTHTLCTHTNPAALVTEKAFWEQLARHCSGKTTGQRSCWPSWQTSALLHADPACDKPLQEFFHSNPGVTSVKEVFRTSLSRQRASTYRAGELASPSETCCLYSTTLMAVTL